MKISIVLILSVMIGVSLAGDATVAQSPEEVQGFLEANKEGLASILFFDPSIPNGDQIQQAFQDAVGADSGNELVDTVV